MIKIGLTGTLGSGKTTVLGYFKKLGAAVVSCDGLVHHELANNKVLQQKLRKIFGGDIFCGKQIQRSALAERVFSSKKSLDQLSALVYPLVKKTLRVFFRKNAHRAVLVVEVPLLFEAGFDDLFDLTIGVATDRKIQKQRLHKQGRLVAGDIARRLRWQLSLEEKISRCDLVIDNNGGKQKTFNQVKKIVEEKLWKN